MSKRSDSRDTVVGMTVRGRLAALVAALATIAVGLSGCSLLEDDPNSAPEPSVTISRTPPAGSEALARFYAQKLPSAPA